MFPKTRRLVALSGVIALGVAFGDILLVPALADSRPTCERTAAWVDENLQHLPATLDGIAAYPLAYRTAIFTRLHPSQKSALYREQFRRFAEERALTPEQAAVLAEASDLVAARHYELQGEPTEAVQERLERLATEIPRHFPDRADQLVFTRLGPNRLGAVTTRTWRLIAVEALRGSFTTSALTPECKCRIDQPWTWDCSEGFECDNEPDDCQAPPGEPSCGLGGLSTCDGICQNDIIE